jgi:hypothetical protein
MCLDRAAKCAWRTIFERKLGSPHRQATGGRASGRSGVPNEFPCTRDLSSE